MLGLHDVKCFIKIRQCGIPEISIPPPMKGIFSKTPTSLENPIKLHTFL